MSIGKQREDARKGLKKREKALARKEKGLQAREEEIARKTKDLETIKKTLSEV